LTFVLLQEETLEETGWKLVHGDVFRPPRLNKLLASLLGAGIQIFCMALITVGKLHCMHYLYEYTVYLLGFSIAENVLEQS